MDGDTVIKKRAEDETTMESRFLSAGSAISIHCCIPRVSNSGLAYTTAKLHCSAIFGLPARKLFTSAQHSAALFRPSLIKLPTIATINARSPRIDPITSKLEKRKMHPRIKRPPFPCCITGYYES